MAIRQINATDSLETLRSQFNALASQDFGDIANLDSSISSTSIVGAMNELITFVSAAEGFFVVDSTSTRQLVGSGQELTFLGTTNEATVQVQATDTVVVGLPADVTISSSLSVGGSGIQTTSGGNITAAGELRTNTINDISGGVISVTAAINVSGDATLGSINVSGNVIQSSNSNTVTISDNLAIGGTNKITVNGTEIGGSNGDINTIAGETSFGSSIRLAPNKLIIFEGATDDANETALTVTDPTIDRVINFPDAGGDVMLTGATGQITNTNLADNTITSAKFNNAVSLVLYNSSGVALKTLYGAGA
ncbi:MAG: hypothetical protein CML81_01310 [Rhodobiaceae bacterium]|nr:hypothetical protein [Rhodobiaceae bacterium]RPF97690.1 MAG: hypothetical protein CBD87_001300 [Rhizobiales bacterium TMED227]